MNIVLLWLALNVLALYFRFRLSAIERRLDLLEEDVNQLAESVGRLRGLVVPLERDDA